MVVSAYVPMQNARPRLDEQILTTKIRNAPPRELWQGSAVGALGEPAEGIIRVADKDFYHGGDEDRQGIMDAAEGLLVDESHLLLLWWKATSCRNGRGHANAARGQGGQGCADSAYIETKATPI